MASSPITSKAPANGIQYQGGRMATDQNVLQKHVPFFDQNNDGIIYPWETFQVTKIFYGTCLMLMERQGFGLDGICLSVPSKFEEIFSKHARTNSFALTSDELMGMLKSNTEPKATKDGLRVIQNGRSYMCFARTRMGYCREIRSELFVMETDG